MLNPVFSYRNGIYLLIHNQTTRPVTLNGGITIKTGAETYVAVTRTLSSKLAAPYSDCITDLTPFSDYSKTLFGYFADLNVTTYDQDLCVSLCYQDKLIDNCSCSSLKIQTIRDENYCLYDSEVTCKHNFDNYFSQADPTVVCGNVCRDECSKVTYDLSTYQASYPNDAYLSDVIYLLASRKPSLSRTISNYLSVHNLSGAYRLADQSVLKVTVNYAQNTYATITESPAITSEGLLGNIGGQLALFLGISLLSLVEIVDLLLELAITVFCSLKSQIDAAKIKPLP